MTLEWINPQVLYEKYRLCEYSNLNSNHFNELYNLLIAEYPTPEDWLRDSCSKRFKSSHKQSEYAYTLLWTIETEEWKNTQSQSAIINYLTKNKIKHTYDLFIGEITGWYTSKMEQTILSVDENYNNNRLRKICLLLKKPLNEITDSDVTSLPDEIFSKTVLSRKRLQNIRIKLGYSNFVIKRKTSLSPKINDRLFGNPVFGKTFKDYINYVSAVSNNNKKYIGRARHSLIWFEEFLIEKRYTSCANFRASDFEMLINYISEKTSIQTATTIIPKVKLLFDINTQNPLFPDKDVFCHEYWSYMSRVAKKTTQQGEGRAFSNIELPSQIVTVLQNYKPDNEVEFLCRHFWLIIASCPCRFSYVLGLEANEALQPLPNNPKAYGLYSRFADKAGNMYGQFPILDKIGTDSVKALQRRARELSLPSLYDTDKKTSYVHLFQLTKQPWFLERKMTVNFFDKILSEVSSLYPEDENLKASAHSFRHYLITYLASETGDEEICQTASGHKNIKMTRQYLRSQSSKQMLLKNIVKKYQNKELTGKFYLKLVDVLSSEDSETEDFMKYFTPSIKVEEYLASMGKKMDNGYCFSTEGCPAFDGCWDCENFAMTKDEINYAVSVLTTRTLELKSILQSQNMDNSNSLVKHYFDIIAIIQKRLFELGISEEKLTSLVFSELEKRRQQ